jgi:hypothetical protein
LAAVIGEATRFPTGAHFKSYLGQSFCWSPGV